MIIVIIALLIVALYPVIRDFFRQRRATIPDYVEGLKFLLDGKIEAAAKKLKQAVEEDTNNIDAYIRLGNIFLKQGDTERALRIHENLALRRNLKPGEEIDVYRVLVKDYLKTGRKVKAIPLLEELIRVDRNDIASRELLLDLYIENNSWEKCEEIFKDLPKIDRQRTGRLYALYGYAYGKVNPKAGVKWLNEALKLNQRSIVARLFLGDLLLSQGEVNQAIQIWRELLEIAPEKNYLVRDRLERAYFESGHFEEITSLYRQLLNRVPQDPGLVLALAGIYAKMENTKEARNILERANRNGNVATRILLAQILLEEGENSRARSVINEALQKITVNIHRCEKCQAAIPQSEIRCFQCKTWRDDIA
ncbi:MAG: tetratricopeptide repeat protein [bacterium]